MNEADKNKLIITTSIIYIKCMLKEEYIKKKWRQKH